MSFPRIVKDQAEVKMCGNPWGRRPNTKGHLECRAETKSIFAMTTEHVLQI